MALLLELFAGCGAVTLKDEIYYAVKPQGLGAFEAHSLTTYQRDLTAAQWQQMSPGMICTSIQSFADTKSAIETLCSQAGAFLSPACSYDTTQAAETLVTNIQALSAKARKAK